MERLADGGLSHDNALGWVVNGKAASGQVRSDWQEFLSDLIMSYNQSVRIFEEEQ
jgi:hypothetical protein